MLNLNVALTDYSKENTYSKSLNEDTSEQISKSWLPKRTIWVTTSNFGQLYNILDFFKFVTSGIIVKIKTTTNVTRNDYL